MSTRASLVLALSFVGLAADASAQIVRVSVSSAGVQANGDGAAPQMTAATRSC